MIPREIFEKRENATGVVITVRNLKTKTRRCLVQEFSGGFPLLFFFPSNEIIETTEYIYNNEALNLARRQAKTLYFSQFLKKKPTTEELDVYLENLAFFLKKSHSPEVLKKGLRFQLQQMEEAGKEDIAERFLATYFPEILVL